MPRVHPLCAALAAIRQRIGLSRTAVARLAGRDQTWGRVSLYGWEAGRCEPTLAGIDQWAAGLGLRLVLVPVDDPAPIAPAPAAVPLRRVARRSFGAAGS